MACESSSREIYLGKQKSCLGALIGVIKWILLHVKLQCVFYIVVQNSCSVLHLRKHQAAVRSAKAKTVGNCYPNPLLLSS